MRKPPVSMPEAYGKNSIRTDGSNSIREILLQKTGFFTGGMNCILRGGAEAAMRKRPVSMPEAYGKNGIRTAGSTSKSDVILILTLSNSA